jgi:hypothetical protein
MDGRGSDRMKIKIARGARNRRLKIEIPDFWESHRKNRKPTVMIAADNSGESAKIVDNHRDYHRARHLLPASRR